MERAAATPSLSWAPPVTANAAATPRDGDAVDGFAPDQGQFFCRSTVEPGVKAFERRVLRHDPMFHSDGYMEPATSPAVASTRTVETRAQTAAMSQAMPGPAGRFRAVLKARIPPSLHLDPPPSQVTGATICTGGVDGTRRVAIGGVDAAELAVSELVTNAYLHTGTTITVSVSVGSAGRVRIEVSDDSRLPPEPQPTDLSKTAGRGLALLSAYGEWGVASHRGGKMVWFEPAADAGIPRQSTPGKARRRLQIRR
jgi:hypothetical protein